jgi:uncharacterized membrane protein YuzA (DUF378 family)
MRAHHANTDFFPVPTLLMISKTKPEACLQKKNTMQTSSNETYFKTRDLLLYLTAPVLVIGGLNWLATGVQNIRKKETATKSDDLANALGLPTMLVNVLYVLIGIAALGMVGYLFMFTFGPPSMLNKSFFPSTLVVDERVPDNVDAVTKVHVTPHAKVAYWAAYPPVKPGTVYENPQQAYNDFANAGLAIADANGDAVLRFRTPGSYKVRGVTLPPHVHYRSAAASSISGFEAETWSAAETTFSFESFVRD